MTPGLRMLNNRWTDPTVVDRMPDRLIEEFAPALLPKWTHYIPIVPTTKQWAFLMLDCQEAMYGGAVGGGKSVALLMGALQYVDVPGYSAILFRRTYADLERAGALIPMSHEWLEDTDAHWDGRRWTFPSGAKLEFGYLDNDKDVYRYQGGQWQYLAFDELTQLREGWYRYLFSRARTPTGMPVPTRVRSATNPGGIGHEWVRQRFLTEGLSHGRIFISARLEDNPYLDQTEYDASLRELDPITRQQLRHGDWAVRPPGVFFKRQWIEIVSEVPAGLHTVRMWDFAATKNQTSAFTAGVKLALHKGVLYILDIRRIRGDPGEVEALVRQTAELDGRETEVWIEQEPGSGGVNTLYRFQRSVLVGYAVRAFKPTADKLSRATPLSGHARAGNVKLLAGRWVNAFLDEAEAFPESFRDQIDAAAAGFLVLTQQPQLRVRVL